MTEPETSLNVNQAEAVAHDKGAALILAGAGSGKTRVITSRAVRLISGGVAPWAIFCVTFTNKAAGEMKSRISSMLGIDTAGLWVSTFHSACLRILREEYKNAGYSSMPVIFDATDQKSVVRSIVKNMGKTDAELPARKVISYISRYKNDMKGPDELLEDAKNPQTREIAEAFRRYQEELYRNNGIDFDDLLAVTVKLFQARPDLLAGYGKRFQYIMVDEFQDTNAVQYLLLKMLAGKDGNLFVVGDDDQSIYRWRGARVGNILGFEKDFPNCRVIKLEENYRSTGNILKAAGEVVREVAGRKEKTLWTRQPPGESVTIVTAENETAEAEFIVREIGRNVDAGKFRYRDFAVFYRTNAQSRVIEECLTKRSLPYRIYGGLRFYSRKEIKDAMAWFRLAVNEHDEVSFLRAISSPPRGVGSVSLSKLKSLAVSKGISILKACAEAGNAATRSSGLRLMEFYGIITDIRKRMDTEPAADIIRFALERSGMIAWLLEKKTSQDIARVENLEELTSAPHKNEKLAEFLERTTLQAEGDEVEESGDQVSLMTLHVSKGLEFPVVFIAGMEEGLFPHFNSMESFENLDEERRLCYVGMTRAMRKLYLAHACNRLIFGQRRHNEPSPFLAAIPEDIAERKFYGKRILSAGGMPPRRAKTGMEKTVGKEGYAVGRKVKHEIFGQGIIRKREGAGDNMKLTVHFRHAGHKKLLSRYVKLSY
jgi:DNA helicase-2/ATP-dependent DNA helicase PcrA